MIARFALIILAVLASAGVQASPSGAATVNLTDLRREEARFVALARRLVKLEAFEYAFLGTGPGVEWSHADYHDLRANLTQVAQNLRVEMLPVESLSLPTDALEPAKDCINYPDARLVRCSYASWQRVAADERSTFVLHEILGLAREPDENYEKSTLLFSRLQKFGAPFLPHAVSVITEGSALARWARLDTSAFLGAFVEAERLKSAFRGTYRAFDGSIAISSDQAGFIAMSGPSQVASIRGSGSCLVASFATPTSRELFGRLRTALSPDFTLAAGQRVVNRGFLSRDGRIAFDCLGIDGDTEACELRIGSAKSPPFTCF